MVIIQFRLDGDTNILTYQFNDVDTFNDFRNLFSKHLTILDRINGFVSTLDNEELIYSENEYKTLLDDFDIYMSENGECLEYIDLINLNE